VANIWHAPAVHFLVFTATRRAAGGVVAYHPHHCTEARMLVTALLASAIAVQAPAENVVAQTASDPELDIREWQVPWGAEGRPRDPYVAPDGAIWFVGQRADYVGVLDPTSGDFRRIDLPEGAGPHTVVVAPDGTPWYAGNRDRHIGKIDPATGQITRYDVPDDRVRDPHTLDFDSQGRIWFTAQGGGHVGRFDPRTEEWEIVALSGTNYRPYGIVVDDQDRPWFVMMGSNRLGTVDPSTLQVREIELPRAETRSRRLGITDDGRVWYADWAEGYLGAYDPSTDRIQEWAVPGTGGKRPYAMQVAGDRVWFFETGENPNRLIAFDPATERYVADVAIPSGGGTVRHVNLNRATRELWFGTDVGTIGRAILP
jgi:virginiamycin B lyase